MKLTLLFCAVPALLSAAFYQRKLAKGATKGGAISLPKLIWLFYALTLFFFINPVVGFSHTINDSFILGLKILFFFVIGRAIFQGVSMYLLKNWTPYFGMALNLIAFLIASVYIFKGSADYKSVAAVYLPAVLLKLNAICFALDLYYAYAFNKIVGKATQGDEPVWYANSEDPKFKQLNTITAINNVFLILLFIYLIYIA